MDKGVRCPFCQAQNPIGASECSVCQRGLGTVRPDDRPKARIIRSDEWEEKVGYEDAPHQARRIAWVSLGGVLVLMAGALGLIDAVFMIGLGAELDILDTNAIVCTVMMTVFGIVAVMGGFLAIMRLQFPLAVIGGVSGIFAYGCAIGAVLSIVGLVIIVAMRKEFSR